MEKKKSNGNSKQLGALYKSREIRWFFKNNNHYIMEWFSNQGIEFSKTEPRTDFYLPLPGKEDLSIKLREGNIEIKQRTQSPVGHSLTARAIGSLEHWDKWSFDVEDQDGLSTSITKEKGYNWTAVYKERIGVKVTTNDDGTVDIRNIKEEVSFGCQIEYTRLLIDKEEWFTFGLEWFGSQDQKIGSELLEKLIGASTLYQKDSMGYNAFLNKILWDNGTTHLHSP